MKKILSVLLALVLAALPLAVFGEDAGEDFGGVTLNVYNWGEYIDKDVLREFEKKYNCKVNYKTYESNEALYTNIIGGEDPWDILVPSDYMIQRFISEKRLQPLDKSIVNNLDNLTDAVKNLPYDPDNTYSVPYLWQSVGIVYDTTEIDPETVEEKGWDIFLDPDLKGHAYMYDSSRDAFMIALKSLGYSANTSDEAELEAAFEWLRNMDKAVNPSYVTDEVIDAMANGEKWMALVYSGDATYILSENEDMGYCTPKEGTNVAIDAMVIPANANNPKLANVFINYILQYENSLMISEEVGYASSNDEVLKELSGEGGDYEGNEAYVPRSGYELDEYYNDIPESLRSLYSSMWIKVKLHE